MMISLNITNSQLAELLQERSFSKKELQNALIYGIKHAPSKLQTAPQKLSPTNIQGILNIKKTKDKPRKAWHRTCGKKTGVGIMTFWAFIFEGNETLPPEERMTNAEIERQVRAEFPHESTLIRNLDTGNQSVNYYRHLYNKGRMNDGIPPKKLSFRYNEDGDKVNTRTGRRKLSRNEIKEYKQKYYGETL
tara:strand:+ start:213 stop:785 length:573 start_codon:yes stop_codon:yes gene_type:complete